MIDELKKVAKRNGFNKINSAVVQGEFYSRCKENGIICYLEFKWGKSRFDALIFDKNLNKRFIVEIKSYKDEFEEPNYNTKQLDKYRRYDLPVLLITRLEQIDEIIKQIKNNL